MLLEETVPGFVSMTDRAWGISEHRVLGFGASCILDDGGGAVPFDQLRFSVFLATL